MKEKEIIYDAGPHKCPLCSWQCTCSDQPCGCCIEDSDYPMEEKVTIEEMFEFVRWVQSQMIGYSTKDKEWQMNFDPYTTIAETDLDLWNKFKQEKETK